MIKIKDYFKNNHKILAIIAAIIILLSGFAAGWVAKNYPIFAGKKVNNIMTTDKIGCNKTEPEQIFKGAKTIIDGVITKIDLTEMTVVIKAKSFTLLSDLTTAKAIDQAINIKLNKSTQISSVDKGKGGEPTALKLEDLKVDDNVAVIVGGDFISASITDDLVAESIRVIKF